MCPWVPQPCQKWKLETHWFKIPQLFLTQLNTMMYLPRNKQFPCTGNCIWMTNDCRCRKMPMLFSQMKKISFEELIGGWNLILTLRDEANLDLVHQTAFQGQLIFFSYGPSRMWTQYMCRARNLIPYILLKVTKRTCW